MSEKDLLKKIQKDAGDITPPPSLQPQAIERLLREQKSDYSSDNIRKEKSPHRLRKRRSVSRSVVRWGSIAAVFALCVTVAWHSGRSLFMEQFDGQNAEMSLSAVREQAEFETEAKTSVDSFTYASSYREVYDALSRWRSEDAVSFYEIELFLESMAEPEEVNTGELTAQASDSAASASSRSENGSSDFSSTNLQELGVDEADIVKTDGSYIYILREDFSLVIAEAENGKAAVAATVSLEHHDEQSRIQEMYLDGDTLHIVITDSISSLEEDEEDVFYHKTKDATVVYTWDVSDPASPVLTGTVSQEGVYKDSRKNGRYLYLFTVCRPVIEDTYEDSVIAPLINGEEAAASDFYLPETLSSSSCLVISSVDTEAPSEILDTKVLVSGASLFYVSADNIYIANETGYGADQKTELVKFHYENGEITGAAAGSVKGYLNDSFSLNEYDGHLRAVTTYYDESYEEHNALYILDEALGQTGAIEGLAEGETIRSARFFGDTGYFVTFRQTDPLFSVDLSDPSSPQILGELKISGFSSYLHRYGDGLLLGIGYEADESTGSVTGLKLSMFDVSDPANVTEKDRLVIQGITWCPAIEDYKAILVDAEKNVIGFYCSDRYFVFSYDPETGFTQELTYDFFADALSSQANYSTMRGLYIGDTLFLAGNTFILSFDMENEFEKLELLQLS